MGKQRSESQRLILQKMVSEGYTEPLPEEITIYMVFGQEYFNKVIAVTRECALLEAQRKKIDPKSLEFDTLYKEIRAKNMEDILDDSRLQILNRGGNAVEHNPLPPEYIYNSRRRESVDV